MMEMKPKVRRETVPADPERTRVSDAGDSATNVLVRPGVLFDSVKVFAATKFTDRANLGEVVTAWIAQNPANEITEIAVRQSSDAEFHCVTLIVFYRAGR